MGPTEPEQIVHRFAEAWNNRDAVALAMLFADDADFVNVVGLWWHKRGDIERAHAYGLGTFFRESTLSAGRVAVKHVGDGVAVIHVRWRLSGQLDQRDAPLDDRRSIMVFVAERRDGRWVVIAAQNTDVVPGAETMQARRGGLRPADYRE